MLTSTLFLFLVLLASAGCSCQAAGNEEPSLFLNSDELSRLRNEIRTVSWKRAIYEGTGVAADQVFAAGAIRPSADRWLNRDITVPPRGGHYHHFFCECGNRLVFPEDARVHPEGYPCSACGKVYSGEKYDAVVRWQVHNQLAVAAQSMGLVCLLEGKREYGVKAAEILQKIAEAYPGPHTSLLEGGLLYQSLDESVWSITLAGAYDLVRAAGVLSQEQKDLIENRLLRQIASGLIAVRVHGNWESWHLSAVGVIGYALGDRKLVHYALGQFRRQMEDELGEDGLWPESVHTYHFYPLGAFLYLAEAAYHDGTDLYHYEPKPGKSLKEMFLAPLAYMYPDTRLPAINDGWYNSFLPAGQYELAFARIGDPKIGWALREAYRTQKTSRNSFWALLQGRPLAKSYPKPDLRSTNFPVLGIAALRSPEGAMMTFDYGPFLGHGQLDKMGVTLFALGKVWAADYGTPGYGSAIMPWYTGTPGHNTVVVDGANQQRTKERKLTLFARGETFEAAQADTQEAYPGVLHRRTVLRVGERFVLLDHLESETEHTYDWLLRSEGELTVPNGGQPSVLAYEHLTDARSYGDSRKWLATWRQEESALQMTTFASEPVTLVSARCPAETARRMVPLVIVHAKAQSLDLVTVLSPQRNGKETRCELGDSVLRIEDGEIADFVALRPAGPGSIETDGKFALVRTKGGPSPVVACLIEGSKVVWNGRALVETGMPASSMEVKVR